MAVPTIDYLTRPHIIGHNPGTKHGEADG
jgi:hypothetical protein